MATESMRLAEARGSVEGRIFESRKEGIDELNKRIALALTGKDASILFDDDPLRQPDEYSEAAVRRWFSNWKFKDPKLDKQGNPTFEMKPVFTEWLGERRRRSFRRVEFLPHKPSRGACGGGVYNTFLGWRIQPKAGDWRHFARHLFHVVADNDPEVFEYIVAWHSQLFREPQIKPGAALGIWSTGKGTGKSLMTLPVRRILGPHALVVSRSDDLIGRFNDHLAKSLYVVSEESTWAGRPEQASQIKNLITGDTPRTEGKFQASQEGLNFCRFAFISNEQRAFAVEGGDERRFCVTRVDERYKGFTREYFDPLIAEISGDGRRPFSTP